MTRKLISSGSSFEAVAGYSRAVVDGDWIFVSGTTGFDYKTMTIDDDVVEQAQQCFRNIAAALQEAGSSLEDAVRVRAFIANRSDFERVAPVFGEHLGRARPANTTVVAELIDPRMKIEIEVTARRR